MDTEKLEYLYSLKQKGILTEKEFQEQKKILLKHPTERPMVPWKQAYVSFWKNAFNWQGRASRAEYWWPTLTNGILSVIFGFILGMSEIVYYYNHHVHLHNGLTSQRLLITFTIILLIPQLAVMVRRFHDLNHSAKFCVPPFLIYYGLWGYFAFNVYSHQEINFVFSLCYFLYSFVYIIVWAMVFPCLPGKQEPNQYGNPK